AEEVRRERRGRYRRHQRLLHASRHGDEHVSLSAAGGRQEAPAVPGVVRGVLPARGEKVGTKLQVLFAAVRTGLLTSCARICAIARIIETIRLLPTKRRRVEPEPPEPTFPRAPLVKSDR